MLGIGVGLSVAGVPATGVPPHPVARSGQLETHNRVVCPAGERGLARRGQARLDHFLPLAQARLDCSVVSVICAYDVDTGPSKSTRIVYPPRRLVCYGLDRGKGVKDTTAFARVREN